MLTRAVRRLHRALRRPESVDTPAVETPAVDTPAVDTPAVEAPAVDTPAVDTPAVDTPAVEAPREQDTESDWIRFSPPVIADGHLTVHIVTENQTDHIRFSVPTGFESPHPDLAAVAMAPLCGRAYRRITFDYPVSGQALEAIIDRTGAEVTTSGHHDPRPPGGSMALNFSGGMDSLAAHLLAPDDQLRIAIDFGGWFERERAFFEQLAPDVICVTDFRSKKYDRQDWLFMATVGTLLADHLDLGWLGFGTNFESSPWNYRDRSWSGADDPALPLLPAAGLSDCTMTRGMTEFCGSLVVAHFRPDLFDGSLESLADAGSEKRFRKRLAYDSAVAHRGGPPVDLSDYEFPTEKIRLWESYPVDLAMLVFMAMYPDEVIDHFIADLDHDLLRAAKSIRPDFVFRYQPGFLPQIPAAIRDTVLTRLRAAGIEPYRDDDWDEYAKLRRLLERHYRFPV